MAEIGPGLAETHMGLGPATVGSLDGTGGEEGGDCR
jgi:hypothetical protein